MKAYKCDICSGYCDDVFTIQGISKPGTYEKYSHLQNTSADCCDWCYNVIMKAIADMIHGQGSDNNAMIEALRKCIYFKDDCSVHADSILLQKFCKDFNI